MTIRLGPGPVPSRTDLLRAQQRDSLVLSELTRVRAAAASWRTGLAGLLASITGFGLIRGRADFTTMAKPWPAVVGVLLALSITFGGIGAFSLMRAAGGRPSVANIRDLEPAPVMGHVEALFSAKALRRGIWTTLVCALFLITSVAVSWYGPAKVTLFEVRLDSGRACGTPLFLGNGALLVRTSTGDRFVNLMEVRAMQVVGSC
jgi:hypothetical protein